jgi:integrase
MMDDSSTLPVAADSTPRQVSTVAAVASIFDVSRAMAAAVTHLRSTGRQQTAARIRAYLEIAGHGADVDGPLFRPLRVQRQTTRETPVHGPDAIDRVVRKYATELVLDRGYSAHSMRATFITMALENGAQLEDMQKAAGHRNPGTTKLYDRRGYKPEKAASFFATY